MPKTENVHSPFFQPYFQAAAIAGPIQHLCSGGWSETGVKRDILVVMVRASKDPADGCQVPYFMKTTLLMLRVKGEVFIIIYTESPMFLVVYVK